MQNLYQQIQLGEGENIILNAVQSSNIKSVAYCKALNPKGNLYIMFSNDKLYRYRDFPEELWNAFSSAESMGSFFAKNIKSQYPGELCLKP